jgi:DNA helicase-2/ATP-dependent DNA helicase PcrA
LRQLFASYVEAKQRQYVLDYDDLLLYWAEMMAEPSIAVDIASRFDHVLVDEYQDTNRLQASVLLALRPNGRGLTVVGDDAQSIYSFRAATVRNILDFPAHFNPRAEIITLEQNYRSTQPILSAATAVINLARERFTKHLWSDRASTELPQLVSVRDETDQARYVATKILAYREAGIRLKTQAVLFRASQHSAQVEIELIRRNIPYVKFGGLKFLEAAHIKDVLSFLRWAENVRAGSVDEIEEERRLLYVAMTRAKDHLHLMLPQRFFAYQQKSNGDRHMYAARTRFIPESILHCFESCAWPVAPQPKLSNDPERDPVNIGAQLRRMWS